MKAIILAAGQGTRLRPLTDDRPKCMVEYCGRPIIDYILEAMYLCGIKEIAVVGGYKIDVLKSYLQDRNLTFFENKSYETTNMVSTLFCAREWFDDDLIISYSDIIYKPYILQALLNDKASLSTTIDKNWLEMWRQRMANPLEDAETLKIDAQGCIVEIGKKPKSYDDVEGQYMGLVKIKKEALFEIVKFYDSLNKNAIYDGKDFYNMYMTSLLQLVIDRLLPIRAVLINGGWLEIDSKADLSVVFGK